MLISDIRTNNETFVRLLPNNLNYWGYRPVQRLLYAAFISFNGRVWKTSRLRMCGFVMALYNLFWIWPYCHSWMRVLKHYEITWIKYNQNWDLQVHCLLSKSIIFYYYIYNTMVVVPPIKHQTELQSTYIFMKFNNTLDWYLMTACQFWAMNITFFSNLKQ